MTPNADTSAASWIIQRCTQERRGTELLYEDWWEHLLPELRGKHLVATRDEIEDWLAYCEREWPEHEFRAHNTAACSCHSIAAEAKAMTPDNGREISEDLAKVAEVCREHIEAWADDIYVREVVDGEWNSYALSELPPKLAMRHAMRR